MTKLEPIIPILLTHKDRFDSTIKQKQLDRLK